MSPTLRRRADIETTDNSNFTPGKPLVLDTSAPATPTFVPDAATTKSASLATEKSGPESKHGMSNVMKLGLAIIPVAIILIGVLVLFWYRKRRAAKKAVQIAKALPPIPKKDIASSHNSSVASKRVSSKVLNMSAFSTPLDGPYPTVQPIPKSATRFPNLNAPILPRIDERVPTLPKIEEGSLSKPFTPFFNPHRSDYFYTPPTKPKPKTKKNSIHINMAAAKSLPNIDELDSPIDGSSPFRLKRGDTVRRSSLGSDLFRLWPTPPTSVWIRPMSVYENMYEECPPLKVRRVRQSSVYSQPDLGLRYESGTPEWARAF